MDPISTGFSLGGGLIQGAVNAGAERRRNRATAQGITDQARAGIEAGIVANDLTDYLLASRPDVAGTRQQFVGALRGLPQVSGLPTTSRTFRDHAGRANAGTAAYGADLADVFARVRAPLDQRRREALQMQTAGGRIADIARNANSQDFLTQLKVNSIQPNQWGMLAGGLMQNAGNSGLFGGGSSAFGSAPKAPARGLPSHATFPQN